MFFQECFDFGEGRNPGASAELAAFDAGYRRREAHTFIQVPAGDVFDSECRMEDVAGAGGVDHRAVVENRAGDDLSGFPVISPFL